MTFESLYHGTDARILAMTAEEKDDWKRMCIELADMLRRYYPNMCYLDIFKSIFEKEDRKDIYFNLSEAIGRYEGMKNGSAKYQYGDIYLTNGLDRAKSYAYRSFAFGEVGLNAYRMLEAAKFLGLKFDPKSRVASLSNQLWTFAHDNPQPIVLTFHHVSSDDLLLDNGKELKGLDELLKDCTMSFRAKKNDNFNLNMAEIQKLPTQ